MRTGEKNGLRALVLAPFFDLRGASRPFQVAAALAELMPVDVVTSDFDHTSMARRAPQQNHLFEKIVYLQTTPYAAHVSVARLVSHVRFSWTAFVYFLRHRGKYSVIYATVPLNLLAWLVFCCAGSATTILDVVDIWPDALPFPTWIRRVCAPIFFAWKWFFRTAVGKADVVISVCDSFLGEARRFAKDGAQCKRFYIGHEKLEARVPKEPVFTLAYVGNFGHLYDFETLLDVLAAEDMRSRFQLQLVGMGDRQEWLLEELARRGIRYQFYGLTFEHAELTEILSRCHAGFNGFVRTTASFSYKAGTYLASGLPLVNSMPGDLRRLVADFDLGENYQGGDREQLREALLRLYHRPFGALEARCRSFFDAELEAGNVHQQITGFLAEILNLPAPALDRKEQLVGA